MDGEYDEDASSWSSSPPDPDCNSDDDVASWPSIYSYHGSRYPHQERFMDEDGVTVRGSLHRIPHAQYVPWVREWLQQEPDWILMGASLRILNGGIFNHDDIPIEFQSILEGEYEVTSSCGQDWVSFSHISVIMDQNPNVHPFTLLLTERCMLLRPDEGTREDVDTNGSLTDGHSSDEDYSLSDNKYYSVID